METDKNFKDKHKHTHTVHYQRDSFNWIEKNEKKNH